MKKFITLILSVILCFSLSVSVFAYDLLEEAVKKFREMYPDIPYEEIADVITSNEGLDTAKIKEALDSIVARYTTKPTEPTEPTTKKQEEPTTKKQETPSTTKKVPSTTKPTTSFTYPTRTNNPVTQNNPATTNSINIVLPNQTTEPQSTQAVSIYPLQPATTPGINNNTTAVQNNTSGSTGLSGKTIMAIVIIAVGGLLLLVCIIVLASSSNSGNAPSRRRRRRKINSKDDTIKDYIPLAQAVMPEVKINTAADLALKKKGALPQDVSETGNDGKADSGEYSLSAFDIPINTYTKDGKVDESTADAIDSAIAYAAAKAAEYNTEYKNSITAKADEEPVNIRTASVLLNESVNTERICPDCGKYVDEDLMFCPECGAFMGIIGEEIPESDIENTVPATEPENVIPEDEDIIEDFTDIIDTDTDTEQSFVSPVEIINEDSFIEEESPEANFRLCPECGAKVEDGLMFCPECGYFIEDDGTEKDVITDTEEALI